MWHSLHASAQPCLEHTYMAFYRLPLNLRVVFFYNVVSFTLWSCCLGRFCILYPLVGRRFLPGGMADFFHLVAIMPLIGFFVVNLCGRDHYSPSDLWGLFSGLRIVWVCYGVIFPHPIVARHIMYSVLIVAWSTHYLIDSGYHAFRIKTRSSPSWLFWLQYHHFYLTFPLEFCSEAALLFLSLGEVDTPTYDTFLQLCLLAYFPVGYFTFNFLQSRRRTRFDDYMTKRLRGRTAVEDQAAS